MRLNPTVACLRRSPSLESDCTYFLMHAGSCVHQEGENNGSWHVAVLQRRRRSLLQDAAGSILCSQRLREASPLYHALKDSFESIAGGPAGGWLLLGAWHGPEAGARACLTCVLLLICHGPPTSKACIRPSSDSNACLLACSWTPRQRRVPSQTSCSGLRRCRYRRACRRPTIRHLLLAGHPGHLEMQQLLHSAHA